MCRSGSSKRTSPTRAVAERDLTRQAEVAPEPRVQEHAAVGLDGELAGAGAAGVGAGLDAEVRRVGVGADQPERGTGVDRSPRHQGAVADDEGRAVVDAAVVGPDVAGLLEPAGGLGGGVERRG